VEGGTSLAKDVYPELMRGCHRPGDRAIVIRASDLATPV